MRLRDDNPENLETPWPLGHRGCIVVRLYILIWERGYTIRARKRVEGR